MPKPNSLCEVCKSPFYAAPKHVEKGWGRTCSLSCRTKLKPNPRFVENDIQCKNCGKEFHVKPTSQKNKKSRVYCSDECRIGATTSTKVCEGCNQQFVVPKSHEHKRKFCSSACRFSKAMCKTDNCRCKTCDKAFYEKRSDLNRGIGAGVFCSVECMSRNRGKIKLGDGKYASHLEVDMYHSLVANGLIFGMEREYKFHPSRRWLLDFAWPEKKIGIEVHGGLWSGKFGGHTSGAGRLRDMEKMNEAKILGWRVIEVASNHIKDGKAADWARKLLSNFPE